MTAHDRMPTQQSRTERSKTYVEAAQRGKDSWWRYLLGIILIVFLWLGIGGVLTVAAIAGVSGAGLLSALEDPSIFETISPFGYYLAVNAAFPVFLLSTMLATVLLHRRHPRTLVTAGDAIRWGRVARGFGSWFALVCAAGLAGYLASPSSYSFRPDWTSFIPFALLAVILTPIQVASEELFFRGYLVQASARIFRHSLFLVVVPSIVFMLLHLGNPEMSFATSTLEVVFSVLYYFLFGAFLVWLSLKDGTIELALGAHAAHNLFAIVVLTFKGSALETPALFYTDRGPNPTVNLVTFLVLSALFSLVLFTPWRRKDAPAV